MESNASTTDDDDDDDETSSVANTNTSNDDDDDDDDDADSLNFDDDLQATQAQQAQALTLTPAMIAKSAASALAANPEVKKKVTKRVAKGKATLEDITTLQQSYDDLELNDDDDDENDSDGDDAEDADDGTNYLRKFDSEMRENYITAHHHEMMQLNAAEVDALARVVRNVDGMIVDSMHKTMPFLTKYEKTRVLGQRAKQLNQGAQPLVPVDKKIIDGYLIAQLELQQKALPFIIRRPLPGGKSEYWRLADLELI
jgi:DNA-directed RNA polymerase subunit K/omega